MERVCAQAKEYGHSNRRELAYLVTHSVLHLLGYDHEAGGLEAVRMREKEEAVLIQLGLPRTVPIPAMKFEQLTRFGAGLCLCLQRHTRRCAGGTQLPVSPLRGVLCLCGGVLGGA